MHGPVRERAVTARTTTLKGPGTGRYYVEALPGYYLDSAEPPGRWRGAGATELGLDGDVADDDFLALMAGLDPRSGRHLGTPFVERSARAYDVTCSAPKSVSVLLAAGDDDVRRHVLDAHDTAVTVVVDWIERHAHTRYRVNGHVRVFDAEGIAAAMFRQHTSRALDPQLHSHIVIANRVRSPDDRWLALDARTLKHDQRTLSALYHAGLRAELTRRLGVRWHPPVNGIAEMIDVPDDVLRAFSTRSGAVEARIEEKLDRFIETFQREPTPRERWRLEREAVTDSRPTKASSDPRSIRAEWLEQIHALGLEAGRLVAGAVGRARTSPGIDDAGRERILTAALASLGQQQSTWRVAELVRELAAAVPTELTVPAGWLCSWLDQVADEVIVERLLDLSRPVPAGALLRRDGRPVTESVLDRALTLPDILAEEERLLALAERWMAGAPVDNPAVGALDRSLSGAQLEVAAAVAAERALVLVVGPAGTGKTTALRPAVEQLRQEGRPIFGVAPSDAAADVLAVDTGVAADTLDKLLVEHRLDRPPDHRFDLPAGSTVVVDEAAMVSTPKLAELVDLADRRGWRLALVGDPMQFAAVGRSGMFGHLVDTFGAIELGRVHRFAHAWEREASLRLRRGDVAVVELYDEHERLHGGTAMRMRGAVVSAWREATERGESAAMMAPTTEAVIALNDGAQQRRIDAGEIDPAGPSAEAGPYRIHAGDTVATRQNARTLVTDRHLMVKNRDRWTVEWVHRDGSLTVDGRTGRVRLPTGYVSEYVELAYAETSHANQGRTVDRSFLFLDGVTDTRGIYVPMTRGRVSNEAFVVLRGEETAAEVVAEALSRSWIDRPAVARRVELADPGGRNDGGGREPRDRPLGSKTLRSLLEREHQIDRALQRATFEVDTAQRLLRSIEQRRESLSRSLRDDEARLEHARRLLEEHDRPLRRRRHRYELDSARTQAGWLPGAIDRARGHLAELDQQVQQVTTRLERARREAERQPGLRDELAAIVRRLDADRRARASAVAADPPAYHIGRLGRRPAGGGAAALWDDAAGRVAQHHAAFKMPEQKLLGPEPRLLDDNAYTASRGAAVAAIDRLDRVFGRQPEIEPPHRSLGISR